MNTAARNGLAVLVWIVGLGAVAGVTPAWARDDNDPGTSETVYQVDLIPRWNPVGVMLMGRGYRRWSGPIDPKYGVPATYRQFGFEVDVSPAYAQASVHGEWQPAIFARIRLQYDLNRFFGAYVALLSFPSRDSPFGKDELDARSGEAKTGWGHRVLVQPVLTAKTGPVIIRNATDLAYYRFNGTGPYFYEPEYDTLLEDGDALIDNTTAFLLEPWRGSGAAMLLAGPFYEITHGARAGITRQRVGVQLYWEPAGSIGPFRNPRVYGRLGVNLQDRNRKREMFLIAGFGFDFRSSTTGRGE